MAIELPDPNGKMGQALQQALSNGETVLAAIVGGAGEGNILGAGANGVLVATNQGVIIVKQGAGMMGLGYQRTRYPYWKINSAEVMMKPMNGTIEIHHEADDKTRMEVVWGSKRTEIKRRPQTAAQAPDVLIIVKSKADAAREVAALINEQVARAHAPAPAEQPSADIPEQIRQLAALRDAGALSTDEFEAKKAELLRRM